MANPVTVKPPPPRFAPKHAPKYRWWYTFHPDGTGKDSVIAYTKSEARALVKREGVIDLEPGDIIDRGEALPQTRPSTVIDLGRPAVQIFEKAPA